MLSSWIITTLFLITLQIAIGLMGYGDSDGGMETAVTEPPPATSSTTTLSPTTS